MTAPQPRESKQEKDLRELIEDVVPRALARCEFRPDYHGIEPDILIRGAVNLPDLIFEIHPHGESYIHERQKRVPKALFSHIITRAVSEQGYDLDKNPLGLPRVLRFMTHAVSEWVYTGTLSREYMFLDAYNITREHIGENGNVYSIAERRTARTRRHPGQRRHA